MRAYVLDDEAHARGMLKYFLAEFSFLTLVGEHATPTSAIDEIHRLKPDLLFLDISMPVLNGMEVLSCLEYEPLVIFLTAHDQFAVEAFALNAVDYLVKPVDQVRLKQSLSRARKRFLARQQFMAAPSTRSTITKVLGQKGDTQRVVWLNDIQSFSKQGGQTLLKTLDGETLACQETVGYLAECLHQSVFFRINRSDIIRKEMILSFECLQGGVIDVYMTDGTIYTVSRRRASAFKKWVNQQE